MPFDSLHDTNHVVILAWHCRNQRIFLDISSLHDSTNTKRAAAAVRRSIQLGEAKKGMITDMTVDNTWLVMNLIH